MTPGQITEHPSGPQGAAVSAVGHAHDGAHRVAGRVQALDHVAVDVEHPPLRIGTRAAFGTERPTPYAYGVVGRAVDRAKRALARSAEGGVAPGPVVVAVPAAKVGGGARGDGAVP